MKGTHRRIGAIVAVVAALALVLAFAGAAFADPYLGYDVQRSPGEGNALGNNAATSPVPNGDLAVWYNHTVTLSNFFLYDSNTPDVTASPDPATWTRLTSPVSGPNEIDGQLVLSEQGLYSIDATGQTESPDATLVAGSYIGVDKTKPAAGDNVVPVYEGGASITLTASDALSGPEFIKYNLDGTQVDELIPPSFVGTRAHLGRRLSFIGGNVFGTTFPVGVGTHTLMYTAFDNAGNESNPKTLTFTVLPNGYKPFLGKVGVKAGKNHRMTFRGTVTAAPTAKNVTLTIQRKVKNKWKAFRTLNVNVPAYVGSYSITNYIAPHASFRVMASQGTGASGWTNFAVH